MIRSALEYSSVIYGGFLTQAQSDELERMQATSLGIIWGNHLSYRRLLEAAGIETLKIRREKNFEKFTIKAFKSPVFRARWFPMRRDPGYDLRLPRPVMESKANHDRLMNSPVYRMRKMINDKIEAGEVRL